MRSSTAVSTPPTRCWSAAHPWDTDGARRAGLAATWVNRAGGLYPAYFLAPDLDLSSLVDLGQRLSRAQLVRSKEARLTVHPAS